MSGIEFSNSIMDIFQIWDGFFVPVLDVLLLAVFLFALFGRQNIMLFRRRLIPDMGGYYFHKKYFLSQRGEVYKLYIPFRQEFISFIKSPHILAVLFFVLSFALYRIILSFASLIPIDCFFETIPIILREHPYQDIAFAHKQYPGLNIASIISKVVDIGHTETSYSEITWIYYNIVSVTKIAVAISLLRMFICLCVLFTEIIAFLLLAGVGLPFLAVSLITRRFADLQGHLLRALLKSATNTLREIKSLIKSLACCGVVILIFSVSTIFAFNQYKIDTLSHFHTGINRLYEETGASPDSNEIEEYLSVEINEIHDLERGFDEQIGICLSFSHYAVPLKRVSIQKNSAPELILQGLLAYFPYNIRNDILLQIEVSLSDYIIFQ